MCLIVLCFLPHNDEQQYFWYEVLHWMIPQNNKKIILRIPTGRTQLDPPR